MCSAYSELEDAVFRRYNKRSDSRDSSEPKLSPFALITSASDIFPLFSFCFLNLGVVTQILHHCSESNKNRQQMWSILASFAQHVDCVCKHDDRVIVGLSELEGNVWSGAVCVVNGERAQLAFAAQEHGVSALAAHSSAVLVAGNDSGELRLFGLASLELYRSVHAHDSAVSALVVSGGVTMEQRLVSAAWDG